MKEALMRLEETEEEEESEETDEATILEYAG
jgi:hypothetical protein